jgi:hypothetical protein
MRGTRRCVFHSRLLDAAGSPNAEFLVFTPGQVTIPRTGLLLTD